MSRRVKIIIGIIIILVLLSVYDKVNNGPWHENILPETNEYESGIVYYPETDTWWRVKKKSGKKVRFERLNDTTWVIYK